jgi:DNA-binding transcriptional LysR family regulator
LERTRVLREPYIMVAPRDRAGVWSGLDLAALAGEVPLVRYSIRSGMGAHIDRHLRRLRLQPPPVLEFDATDSVFAMVAAGFGWAITTPLCLLQGRVHLDRLAVLPLPGPALSRSLHLVLRSGELEALGTLVFDSSCRALNRLVREDLHTAAPWLSGMISVGNT